MNLGSSESDVVTQFEFFKCLTKPFLNTLLHRVTSGTFEEHIANKMIRDETFMPESDIEIKTEFNMNDKFGPSIYVSFYEKIIEFAI